MAEKREVGELKNSMKKIDTHIFIILAYKQSQYLEDCIDSLLNQTIKSKIIITTSTPSPSSF